MTERGSKVGSSRILGVSDFPLFSFRSVLVYLVLAVAFAFISLIGSLTYAVLTYVPPGVQPASYVTAVRSNPDHPGYFSAISYHEFANLKELVPDVTWIFGRRARMMDVATAESSAGVTIDAAVQIVSSGFFDVLGVEAWSGRLSIPSAHEPFAVLSEETWKTLFGTNVPGVDGDIVLGGTTVLPVGGVVVDGFHGVLTDRADVWIVIADSAFASLDHESGDEYVPWLEVFGRIDESGPSVASMNVPLAGYEFVTQITKEIVTQTPTGPVETTSTSTFPVFKHETLEIYPGFHVYPWMQESAREGSQVLIGLGLLVIALVAAMLAEFLRYELVRRPKAIWVRFAVGATPSDLVRENLAIHTGWLFLTGMAVVALSHPMKAVLFVAGPFESFPGYLTVSDVVVGHAVSLVILTSVFVLSLSSASFLALRSNLETTPNNAYARITVRGYLLLFLCVVSLTTVVSAASHYLTYKAFDFGFANLKIAYLVVESDDIEGERLRDALGSHPQLLSATRLGILPVVPMSGLPAPIDLPQQRETVGVPLYENHVDASFFDTFGVTTLAGSADLASNENIVLSVSAARMLGDDITQAVGSVMELPSRSRYARVATVSGVVADVKYGGYTEPSPPVIYSPTNYLLAGVRPSFEFWAVHHDGDIQEILSEVRQSLDLPTASLEFMTSPTQLAESQFLAEKGIDLLKGFIAVVIFLLSLSAMHWSELKRLEHSQRRMAIETAIGASRANLTIEYSMRASVRVVTVFAAVCGFYFLLYFLTPSYVDGIVLWAVLPVLAFVLIWSVLTVHTYVTRLVTMKPIYPLTQ